MAGKGNHGNSTEKMEEKFIKEKAEMKDRMKKRNNDARKAKQQKSMSNGQFVTAKSRSERLNIALKQLLDRLIKESASGYIEDVDWRDDESVKRRKASLSNVKDLLSIVKQMKDLISEVRDDEADDEKTEAIVAQNVTLIEEARKSLLKVGVNANF